VIEFAGTRRPGGLRPPIRVAARPDDAGDVAWWTISALVGSGDGGGSVWL